MLRVKMENLTAFKKHFKFVAGEQIEGLGVISESFGKYLKKLWRKENAKARF